jgi:hypothetical protein
MATVLLSVALVGVFFAFISVRLFLVKDGEFKGTCASKNPMLNPEGADCYCGKKVGTCTTAEAGKA